MSQATRRLVHTRSIRIEAFQRDDELWDLVASIQDVKQRDVTIDGIVRKAGEPFHDMQITVTVDPRMQIVEVQAQTRAAPYMGTCDSFPDVYRQLVGLNLLQNFRSAVRDRVGGSQGCTHITELAAILPTAAIQAFAGVVRQPMQQEEKMPPQLDRCRALRVDGPVVARLYPSWARNRNQGEEA